MVEFLRDMPEPHWIITLALGAALGLLASFLSEDPRGRLRRLFRRFRSTEYTRYRHLARVSFRDGRPHLTRRRLTIRRGITHDFQFLTQPTGDDSLSYKGDADVSGGFLVAVGTCQHPDHQETVSYQFPLGTPRPYIVGLSLCQDHDRNVNVSGVVLSEEELDDESVREMLRDATHVYDRDVMIRMH